MDVRALATDGVVLLDGEVLLMERDHDPHAGQWVLPGGIVERVETAASTPSTRRTSPRRASTMPPSSGTR